MIICLCLSVWVKCVRKPCLVLRGQGFWCILPFFFVFFALLMIIFLTEGDYKTILHLSLPHEVCEIGLSETNGVGRIYAVFLCAKSQFIMLDWVRQPIGWVDSFVPLDQPYSAQHLDWSHVVGLQTLQTEAIMPNYSQALSKQKPHTKLVRLKSIYTLFDSNRKLLADSLTFQQAKNQANELKGSIIKFKKMEVLT